MSIVPLLATIARELDGDYHGMHEMEQWDDDFGFGLHPSEIFRPRIAHVGALMHPRRRLMPYERSMMARRAARQGKGSGETNSLMPQIGKEGFQVHMDVSQFKPSELTVKTVDKTIVVEGKHEEREDDHGMIQRHFVRKYTLPKDYDPKDVVSTISTDGVLTVKAPPPPNKAQKQNERIVQIQQTGPAHLSVKAPEQDGEAHGATGKGGKNQNGAAEKMETSK